MADDGSLHARRESDIERDADDEPEMKRDADDEPEMKRDADDEPEMKRDADDEPEMKRDADDELEMKIDAEDELKMKRDADDELEMKRDAVDELEMKRDPADDVTDELEIDRDTDDAANEVGIKSDVADELEMKRDAAEMEIRRRRRSTVTSTDDIVDPDVDLRDTLICKSANSSDDEDEDEMPSGSPKLSESLQHLCGMPGRAFDKVEDIARHLWKSIPGLPLEKAEEIARQAWVAGPGLALDKAEEMAHTAWDAMPVFALEKVEDMARNLWKSVPGLTKERAEEIVRRAWDAVPVRAFDRAEELVKQAWVAGRAVVHHNHLPGWLRDNDFLVKGHRPPLNSFWACFKSIFRIHTETGNIWTHLIGFLAFVLVATYFLTRPSVEVHWEEKAVFSAFFAGAILCLGFSWIFHTVYCHSERVGRIFGKLDYCGIAFLIVGSFVPWLYYSFYCRQSPQIFYLVLIIVLGICCIVVSMWDKFGEPKYRPVRAGVFVALGLSGVIPAAHYVLTEGFYHAWNFAALGWVFLMAFFYIAGAVIYAARIPECIWPGKFDIWFQSHQIFHVFVVAAAFIHYHGMSEVASNRLAFGHCLDASSAASSSMATDFQYPS